jgi:pilus assembly protein CpaB
MNSTLLRTIAILMALGAVVTAWLGYRMSTVPAAPQLPKVQITYPQLVTTRDVAAGEILTAADVRVESMAQRDPAALTSASQAIGKLTLAPVPQGTPVLASHFPVLSPVAQSLQPHERAVAIKVNEVIGVGGFVKPGDHVDVLLYLRAERETQDMSSAQVVLSNVRLLAYGDEAGQPPSAEVTATEGDASVVDRGVNKLESMKAKDGKSAILAVAEQDTARLMLAENSGILKLALRGAVLPNASRQGEERHFVQLEKIGRPAMPEPTVQVSVKKPLPARLATTRTNDRQVIVHHGDRVEVVKIKP